MENLNIPVKGVTIDDKINLIKTHYNNLENDERVGISIDGYEHLLNDLSSNIEGINDLIKNEFELQQANALENGLLLDYNIKPRDVLDLLERVTLLEYCKSNSIKQRGDLTQNILDN